MLHPKQHTHITLFFFSLSRFVSKCIMWFNKSGQLSGSRVCVICLSRIVAILIDFLSLWKQTLLIQSDYSLLHFHFRKHRGFHFEYFFWTMSSVTTTITSPQRHQQQQQQQQQKKGSEINLSDDPDKLLNEWLGELDNLIGVSFSIAFCFHFF